MRATAAHRLASELDKFTRHSAGTGWRLRKGAPEWLKRVCQDTGCTGHMRHDDWVYNKVALTINAVVSLLEIAPRTSLQHTRDDIVSGLTDDDTSDLTEWLASGLDRVALVDAELEVNTPNKTSQIAILLIHAQKRELGMIVDAVVVALDSELRKQIANRMEVF